MSDIRIAIAQMQEPEKSLYEAVMEFYDTMKALEKEPVEHRGGKQATKIVMTVSDIEAIFKQHYPIELSQLVPTERRIKEKALECLKSGECDTFNNPEELFTEGAIWMRKMLIGK